MRLISDEALAVVTVWAEARGEPFAGKVAVAEVIRNRMKQKRRNVAEIVLRPLQFSCWNSHDQNRIHAVQIDDSDPTVLECKAAWLESERSNLTNGANHYWNPTIASPSWGEGAVTVAIGAHLFAKL